MNVEAATEIAIRALQYIAGEEELFSRFIALTGVDLGSLRQEANSPAFLASVLEFLMQDEAQLLSFAANASLAPESIGQAQLSLSGGPNTYQDWA